MSSKAIDRWIENLNSDDKKTRKDAVLALSYTGEAAIEPLVQALLSETIDEAIFAEIMRRMGNEALDHIVDYLREGEIELRRRIAHVFGVIADARMLNALVQALHDDEEIVRAQVATSLGSFNDPRAAQPLIDRLHDDAIMVRASAAESLRNYYRDPGVLPALIEAANDDAHDVRSGVAKALGYIQDERSIEILNQLTEDKDSEVRHNAAAALQHQAGDRMVFDRSQADITNAVSLSIDAMLADDTLNEADIDKMRDSNPRVRARLLEYIAEQSSDKAVILITPGLKDINPAVRQTAVNALARLGEAGIQDIRAVLDDESAYVRAGAVEALGIIQPDDLVKMVAPLIKDQSELVRIEVVRVLTQIPERDGVIPVLREATRDKDEAIRDLASNTLTQLGQSPTNNPFRRFFKRRSSN